WGKRSAPPCEDTATRVCMQRLLGQPEQDGGDDPQGAVGVAALVVAGRQAAELLAAVDQPLHPVPEPVRGPIERAAAPLPPLARDGVADAPPPTVGPLPLPRVAFVSHYPIRPEPRTAAPRAPDRPLLQQPLENRHFVLLARGQHQGQELAVAFRAEMDLRREAALAAPERFGRRVPPLAPAACGCARMTVPSTKWTVQSRCPAASARAWTAASTRSHTPASRQRRKRLYSVDQGPYRSGTSRQGTPVASFQTMPLRIVRWSWLGRPVRGRSGGSSGASSAHCRSVSSWRRMPNSTGPGPGFAHRP